MRVAAGAFAFAAALGAMAGAARAQPAALAAPSAPVATDPTADQIASWIAEENVAPQSLAPFADPLFQAAEARRIHGEVGAFVSNRGYGGYAAAALPVGRASEVDVAVADEHLNRSGPWRGGDRQSLALAIKLDGGDIARLISRDKCNVPRWGVRLPTDPIVLPDGRCLTPEPAASADARPRGYRPGAFGPPPSGANSAW